MSNLELNKANLTLKPQSPAKDLPPYSKSLLYKLNNTNLTIETAEYLPPYSYTP